MKKLISLWCVLTLAFCLGIAMPVGAAGSVAITNVRVFDGEKLSEPRTVVFENGVITDALTAETVIDGEGGALLPGLIDAHVHIEGPQSLEAFAQWGVTTALDMGTAFEKLAPLRGQTGLADFRGSGISTAPAGGQHAAMGCPVVADAGAAGDFIAARVAEGVDFIKIIADSPAEGGKTVSMEDAVLTALVQAAHANGLKVIAHVTLDTSIAACARAGVDVITHTPLAMPVNADLAAELKARGTAAIPTLVMMRCFADKIPPEMRPPGLGYDNAAASISAMHVAGVTIMAGTDANTYVCFTPHGESLHTELALMVEAGMSPTEVLRAATEIPAVYFGLNDRGVIKPGYRADLLLVKGDPTADISAARDIVGVWIEGVRVD